MSDSDAENNPVRRPGREMYSGDTPLPKKAPIETREQLDSEVVVAVAGDSLSKDYADALAMAEEPVTIRIERNGEKFAPKVIDCWVNGRGAEMLIDGKWVVFGALPVGRVVTTKRKYVEVLASARHEAVDTNVIEHDGEDPVNTVDRTVSARAPFSVIRDDNPKSGEWLSRLMRGG